jgi:uncharacterized protein
MPGQPAHFEIPADDTAKGRQFWGSLFDWQFEAMPGPFEYHMTRISDLAGVAITNMEPGKRGIRTYFDVDDINAGATRVKELGGEANDPSPVPSMGWFATCRDPQGNEFGLWQNDPAAPAPTGETASAAGGVSHQGVAGRRLGPGDPTVYLLVG